MRSEVRTQSAVAVPRHVAIIMDGNGRWASQRRRPRTTGHLAGARTVRSIVEHARRTEIPVLTLYAFSSDNWRRPEEEVGALMSLFRRYLASEVPKCVETGIRLSVVGRRDRLSPALIEAIRSAEDATSGCRDMRLRLAVDYSSRDAILEAAHRAGGREVSRERFGIALASAANDHAVVPDVDLLIRTGGEQRLSDFLLWECAYAELHFTERMWPDFAAADLGVAVADFRGRERRFGGVRELVLEHETA